MVYECRFNRPSDRIAEYEFYQYIYAMQLWILQDEYGATFEEACHILHDNRAWPIRRLLEFRTDVDISDDVAVSRYYHDYMEKNKDRLNELKKRFSNYSGKYRVQIPSWDMCWGILDPEPEFHFMTYPLGDRIIDPPFDDSK